MIVFKIKTKTCGGKRPPYHLFQNTKDTWSFKSKHPFKKHKINKKYSCNTKVVINLTECQICCEQYAGSWFLISVYKIYLYVTLPPTELYYIINKPYIYIGNSVRLDLMHPRHPLLEKYLMMKITLQRNLQIKF